MSYYTWVRWLMFTITFVIAALIIAVTFLSITLTNSQATCLTSEAKLADLQHQLPRPLHGDEIEKLLLSLPDIHDLPAVTVAGDFLVIRTLTKTQLETVDQSLKQSHETRHIIRHSEAGNDRPTVLDFRVYPGVAFATSNFAARPGEITLVVVRRQP